MSLNPPSAAVTPANEQERLKRLYLYEILNTPAEEAFDKLAWMAAQIFDAPQACISFTDDLMVYNKAVYGDLPLVAVRQNSLCALTVYNGAPTIIADVAECDANQACQSAEKKMGFYAGVPLTTIDRYSIGTLSVMDEQPHTVTDKQLQMLETLASVVMDELEARLIFRKAVRTQTDLMNITVHDLKNPLSVIRLYGQLIKQRAGEPKISEMANKVWLSAEDMLNSLNDLQNLSKIENSHFQIVLEKTDLNDLLEEVKTDFEILAGKKQLQISIHNDNARHLQVDSARIREVFEQLMSNAIKYSDTGKKIEIYVSNDAEHVLVEFRDQGQGLQKNDLQNLFTKFARLSPVPTGKERSHGLGLSIVKTLVEIHGGKVWASSEGQGMGTSFFISLPVD